MAWIGTAISEAGRFLLTAIVAFAIALLLAINFNVHFGWLCFVMWAGACAHAAITTKAIRWALLVGAPLALVSLSWLMAGYPLAEDPFGMAWVHIYAFTSAALVTAATGTLFLFQLHSSR